jgi:protein-disulfide isomerase
MYNICRLIKFGEIMDKRFIVALTIILGLFAGYLYVGKTKNSTDTKTNTTNSQVSSHKVGAGNKKVTLTEYGDFQCPVCGQYYPLIEQIQQKYGEDITFEFKNFPLDSIHPNARAAHRAAESAGNQGKFFEMYDLLYSGQQSWSSSSSITTIFDGYAKQLGLDMTKYNADFSSKATNDVINADSDQGKKLGITGTPTFFLNGRKLEDSERRSAEELIKAIDTEIAKQNPGASTPAATGTPATTDPTPADPPAAQ